MIFKLILILILKKTLLQYFFWPFAFLMVGEIKFKVKFLFKTRISIN
jgi:hypothetical protein